MTFLVFCLVDIRSEFVLGCVPFVGRVSTPFRDVEFSSWQRDPEILLPRGSRATAGTAQNKERQTDVEQL